MRGREILIYLSLKYEGNWDDIYHALTIKEVFDIEEANRQIKLLKSNAITIIDEEYPDCLKKSFHPPFVLFFYGNIELFKEINVVAVIGSRKCSKYGENMTRSIVKGLSYYSTIVSGLAKGIDYIAHDETINNGGKCIGVLGSGIDLCYPNTSKDLYDRIKKDHLLISEYPNSTLPKKENFPNRNRIVAALSKGVVVTEAYKQSGTLITVGYALALGKDVCCVPYLATDDSSCNYLIKEGAALVQSASDVMLELGLNEEKGSLA